MRKGGCNEGSASQGLVYDGEILQGVGAHPCGDDGRVGVQRKADAVSDVPRHAGGAHRGHAHRLRRAQRLDNAQPRHAVFKGAARFGQIHRHAAFARDGGRAGGCRPARADRHGRGQCGQHGRHSGRAAFGGACHARRASAACVPLRRRKGAPDVLHRVRPGDCLHGVRFDDGAGYAAARRGRRVCRAGAAGFRRAVRALVAALHTHLPPAHAVRHSRDLPAVWVLSAEDL